MDLPRTLLHALHERASRVPDRPALWTRRHGYYLPLSWRDYEARVKQLALGLMELGLRPGGAVGILSFNREEWLVTALAAMAAGGVPVGLYATSSPEQHQHVLSHCQAEILVVDDEHALRRVLAFRDALPRLRHIVVMDPPRPLPPGVLAYGAVLARGQGRDEGRYWNRYHALSPDGLATLIYTAGVTGDPRGVMLSHRALAWTAQRLCQAAKLGDGEVVLSYQPLPQITEQLISLHAAVVAGFQVYFPESPEHLLRNLKEVRPTFFLGVPGIWEALRAKAEESLTGLSPRRASVLDWARKVTADALERTLAHERVPAALEAQAELAKRTVLAPLRDGLGLDRAAMLVSASAPLRRDVLELFRSLGLVIRELYGQAETCGLTALNTSDATRLGMAGRPMLGVAVRIADDGEILVKGGNVCLGYFQEPEATEALLAGGWLHSGDLGELDGEGYLRVTGRKKELVVTSGGKSTVPTLLEVLLEEIPPLGKAMVVGTGKKHLAALLSLDPRQVPAFARERGWPEEPAALAAHPPFREYLDARVEDVNRRLSRFESVRGYHLLPRPFTVADGELSPTHKLRRHVVEEKYRDEIAALYASKPKRKKRATAAERD
ncbi:MAG TPA: long-chain fatty acid--CoA ligase [Myxococcaceae bacterium]|nr:long-chain fatty acid--CoA ligase [Myxococcaceae bacterium]